MKFLVVVACVLGYLAIGFACLVVQASFDYIDDSDVVSMLLLWPFAVILAVMLGAGGGIKILARHLGEKLAERVAKK